MIDKYTTSQQLIATYALHHSKGIYPKWSGNVDEWPTCPNDHPIYTTGNSESGTEWACSLPECEYR